MFDRKNTWNYCDDSPRPAEKSFTLDEGDLAGEVFFPFSDSISAYSIAGQKDVCACILSAFCAFPT